MNDAWDRAVAAEARRRRRLGLVLDQPACDGRQDEYGVGDMVRLANVNGTIATYRVGPSGRVNRRKDG